MAIVYHDHLNTIRQVINFFILRAFRIWPLLWVVSILTILPQILKTGTYDWGYLILNLSTLFGFLEPTGYIATGAWSIGNEMVYYALTPIIFICYNKKIWIGNFILITSLLIGFYFGFFLLDSNSSLNEQWDIYVNPFNNLFFYAMGISIYFNLKDFKIGKNSGLLLIFFSTLLFYILPFNGDHITITTGVGRLIFIVLSFFLVLGFYKMDIKLSPFFSKIFNNLGYATYGVYLIHPLVYQYLKFFTNKLHFNLGHLFFPIVAILTIFLAVISYNYFEIKLIKFSKRLITP